MLVSRIAIFLLVASSSWAQNPMARPRAGKVEILKTSQIQPGMKATAWTVFEGTEPEAVPVEIIGLWKNAWGPRQDIILGKMGGKAQRTNVAGGMSGSPVYVDGKLIGAVALRLSVFSPDAICGITPIELMLEINDFDKSRPAESKSPDRASSRAALEVPHDLLQKVLSASATSQLTSASALMTPIETPLTFAGFHEATLREFGPLLRQMGLNPVQGGASGAFQSPTPAPGWQNALQPGDPVAGVLVSGDMSINGLGTVSYNDGRRVLAFGHPFFNLGPVEMPMAKGEVLMTLSSAFQPNKIANATEIVGALRQDRHSGILGVLGETAEMIPVTLQVRTYADNDVVEKAKEFRFHVFVQQRWTPFLMMVTLFNSINQINEFSDEVTYRFQGKVELDGLPNLQLSTMQTSGELPVPAPMLLAGWWADKFNRLFGNAVNTPKFRRVDATVDLLPKRRIATIETAWISTSETTPGAELQGQVFLRPFRGERMMREFKIKIPSNLPKGEHRLMLSDADTLNRMQSAAGLVNRYMDIPQTVSLLNQERSNNRLYISLVEARPTVYADDKTLPGLPQSILNVMQSGSMQNRPFITAGETASEQLAIPFEHVISGSYSLKISVK
ncbi:MAG: hypothetical protein NZV14_15720 [Bryobacteraceae bacterium]|nr:hypothetical protein [Bryobacteraceae bacterium]MDW8379609.1 hypothetical protein [Bryobacterales bacterium]